MGGSVPLGYNNVDRKLVVNTAEAEIVQTIFRQYLRFGCITKLKEFLDQNQIGSKALTRSAERRRNGTAYSRGALRHLLNNRVYIGETIHKNESYKGQHPAIVPQELWDQVAATLKKKNQAHRTGRSRSTPSLLRGKLFDENGVRFTPTHSVKNSKRYRYYTSQTVVRQIGIEPAITRFPAQELEQFVTSQLHLLLQDPDKCTTGIRDSAHKAAIIKKANELARNWAHLEFSKQHEFIGNILRRVTLEDRTVWIEIDRTKLLATLLGREPAVLPPSRLHEPDVMKIASDFQVLRRAGELRMIAPLGSSSTERAPVPSLVKVAARARSWYEQIVAGEIGTIDQLAQQSGLTRRYVRRILQCANLSPQITEAILKGQHRPNLTVNEILHSMPIDWREQEKGIY